MKRNNKTAISIIVLVITILVLSILAATVIISLSNTNIISQTSNTVFKHDLASYKETYEMYVTNKLAENSAFDRSTLNITSESEEFERIFGNVPDKYKEGLKVVNGKLVYETEDENEKNILKDLVIASNPLQIHAAVKQVIHGVPIPKGFYYVGGTKDTGLVISDDAADVTNGLTGDTAGNQFVWVPVEGYTKSGAKTAYTIYEGKSEEKTLNLYEGFTDKFKRGEINYDVIPLKMTSTTTLDPNYKEPIKNFSGYVTETDEYYEMMESVQEYGGFYIARFEAGDGDATNGTNGVTKEARNNLTIAHTVVSKKGAFVYNYVPWGAAMNYINPYRGTYAKNGSSVSYSMPVAGAVYLSKQMYANSESVVSTLCYGVQWDATMNFVSDNDKHNLMNSSTWGNYSTSSTPAILQTTGSNSNWQAKNIYDLAGNVGEWTMEVYSYDRRVTRGGGFTDPGRNRPAFVRIQLTYAYAGYNYGFRPTLYIRVD